VRERRRRLDFDAAYVRGACAARGSSDRDAADQSAATDRYDDRGLWLLIEDLERDGPGTSDDVRMRVRRHINGVTALRTLLRPSFGVVIIDAGAEVRASGPNGIQLGPRSLFGHVNGEPHAGLHGCLCEGAPVIAGRRGHQRRRVCAEPLRQAEDGIGRATDLVGEGRLERFELEEDVCAAVMRQPFRAAERCSQDAATDTLSRPADVVDRDQDRFASAA
jgi:hypothetical protein